VSFSLVETLMANGVLFAVVVGVAQLFAVTADVNRRAALQTFMGICAAQKAEELRTVAAERASGVDYLDSRGAAVPAGVAAFERRWSIGPLPSDSARLLVIEVIVTSTSRPIDAHAIGVKQRGG
jgi:hypothetical protein